MEGEEDRSTSDRIDIGTSRLTRVITPATVAARRRKQEPLSPMVPRPGFDSILMRHPARQVEWERCRATPRRVTPSALVGGGAEVVFPHTTPRRDAELGRLVGVCAHEVLEQWDFTRPDAEIHTGIMQTIRHSVAQDHPELIHEITENLTSLFERFLSSEPYKILQRATVLGREVPCVMSCGENQLMEGAIDLIYRLDGRIWIADYKTDEVAAEDVQARVDRYRPQAEMYMRAVERALGLSSLSFQFIFLRPGVAVDV
jgi:ATP-dependent helicase/nuclease subunit A